MNYSLLLIFVLLALVPLMARLRAKPSTPKWLDILLLVILLATVFSAVLFGIIFPE